MSMYIPEIKEEVSENAKMLVEDGGKVVRIPMPAPKTQNILELFFDDGTFAINGKKYDVQFDFDSGIWRNLGDIYDEIKPLITLDTIMVSRDGVDMFTEHVGVLYERQGEEVFGIGSFESNVTFAKGDFNWS